MDFEVDVQFWLRDTLIRQCGFPRRRTGLHNHIAERFDLTRRRRILPALGANSLAAARGILAGQGGSAELWKLPDGGLEWRVLLPSA